MSVPVYFNSPLSLLQNTCFPAEYIEILDLAAIEKDPIKRLGLLGVYSCIQHTDFEKQPSKPFNPLLGETFEFMKPGSFYFLAEQVCHHPPICAIHYKGEKGYRRDAMFRVKNKFSGGALTFYNVFKEYVTLENFKETFQFQPVALSFHNLIIGTPYVDTNGRGYVRNMACPKEQYVDVKFTKRGWSQSSYFKLEGDVFSAAGKVAYRITGKWNSQI